MLELCNDPMFMMMSTIAGCLIFIGMLLYALSDDDSNSNNLKNKK